MGSVVEPVFFLKGQPYVYADVGFEDHEDVVSDAFKETFRAYTVYMGAWLTDKRLVEDGKVLDETTLLRRIVELAGGLGALRRHVKGNPLHRPMLLHCLGLLALRLISV